MALATREEQRSVIRFLAIQGESAAKIHTKQSYLCTSQRFSNSEVEEGFWGGRESVRDLARAGWQRKMVTATNAAKVEAVPSW